MYLFYQVNKLLMYAPDRMRPNFTVMGILLFILSTPVQFWAGRDFYKSAWIAAKHYTSNMATLIVIGTTTAYIYIHL